MRRSSAAPVALLILVALATLWAFGSMMGRRFAAGEVYPFYSTLRTDPMGARALYQSLDRLPQTTCVRNFGKIHKLEGTPGQTLMLLNVNPQSFSDGDLIDGEAITKFAATGGRVVITLNGQVSNWDRIEEAAERRRDENRRLRDEARRRNRGEKSPEDDEKKKSGAKDSPDPKGKEKFRRIETLHHVLGVTVKQEKYAAEEEQDEGLEVKATPALALEPDALPKWHAQTTLVFEEEVEDKAEKDQGGKAGAKKPEPDKPPAPAGSPGEPKAAEASAKTKRSTRDKWTVLGEIEDGKAVLAERRMGSGSIILATDSYFASNQALSQAPAAEFLAWLVGEAHQVYFDETHLGTTENPGIMAMARKHNLHGMFVGGLILFALFVWRSSMSLVPPNGDDEDPTRIVAGHGATAGLVSLLKRGISRGQLLARCFESWEKTVPRRHASTQARIDLARSLVPPPHVTRARGGVLTTLYRQICEILHPKRK